MTAAFSYMLFEQSLMPEIMWVLVGILKIVYIIFPRVVFIKVNFDSKSATNIDLLYFALIWLGGVFRFGTCMIESSSLMSSLITFVPILLDSILMCQILFYCNKKGFG